MAHKRMATLVGCNYPNTRNELHGCINDVLSMRDLLVSRFGFELNNIQMLIDDAPGSLLMPTGANIMKTLNHMVDQADPGDVLFFHYSGHGTQFPSKHGFRHDEAIVPCDFDLITDVDFRRLVIRLPEKASFTIISDSCHSGGLIDREKEQIGPSATNYTSSRSLLGPRFISMDSILDNLEGSSTGLFRAKVYSQSAPLLGLSGTIHPDSGILLSGCQANETSADVKPTTAGGKAYGAFSNALQMALKKFHTSTLSNKELIIRTRKVLEEQGIDQHPCLYCSDGNADVVFLYQPSDT